MPPHLTVEKAEFGLMDPFFYLFIYCAACVGTDEWVQ